MERIKTKGKEKDSKKYLSILLVPHSSGKVRTIKFSRFGTKLSIFLIILSVFSISFFLFVSRTLDENTRLKSYITKLKEQNKEQITLLNNKAGEIEYLKQKEQATSEKIRDFLDKYKEITENYIDNRTSSSRSGDRTAQSFASDIKELKNILSSLNELNNSEDGELLSLSETEDNLKEYLDSIPTMWPVSGRISSEYGMRRHPIFWTQRFHTGLDIAASYGKQIVAAGSGKVIFSGYKSGYGWTIIIDHGNGLSSLYGHCSKLLVKKGTAVKKGEIVAKVGSSGTSTGPHLHFEVQVNTNHVDPMNYLDSK